MKKPVLLLALLAGCSANMPLRLYHLGHVSPTEARRDDDRLKRVSLRRVAVPDALDTTDILRRGGEHEYVASRTGRWSERLSAELTDALAADLARLRPDLLISQEVTPTPQSQIFVEILSFSIDGSGACSLSARWRVSEGAPASGQGASVTIDEQAIAADDASVAAAMSQAIDRLAAMIASRLG